MPFVSFARLPGGRRIQFLTPTYSLLLFCIQQADIQYWEETLEGELEGIKELVSHLSRKFSYFGKASTELEWYGMELVRYPWQA